MIKVFRTEEALAKQIGLEMKREMIERKRPVFCLASGSTAAKGYAAFAEAVASMEEVGKLQFVSLDEWVDIPKESEGSCFGMLHKDLFARLPLKEEQVIFFETVSTDLESECKRIDAFIQEHPITYSLMGVGMNGHIGLNEPGCPVSECSSVVSLSETTKRIGQKYFRDQTELERGITLGLQQIINSQRVVVVVVGEHKKEIVKEMFENGGAGLPVQNLMGKSHIDFYLDSAAAQLVNLEDKEQCQ